MAGAVTPGPRKDALVVGTDDTILDAWFAKTVTGGGDITDTNLTAVQARALYSNN